MSTAETVRPSAGRCWSTSESTSIGEERARGEEQGTPGADPGNDQLAFAGRVGEGFVRRRGEPVPELSDTRVNGHAYINRYFGPLPPSRGVQRGPRTSVALQSMQFGGLTTQRVTLPLVDPRGTEMGVEVGDVAGDLLADDQVRGDRVAGGVAGLEHRVDLAEGQHVVGHERLGRRMRRARHVGILRHRDPAAGKGAARDRHQARLHRPRNEAIPEGQPHVPRPAQVAA